jgi:hypothetical protein
MVEQVGLTVRKCQVTMRKCERMLRAYWRPCAVGNSSEVQRGDIVKFCVWTVSNQAAASC